MTMQILRAFFYGSPISQSETFSTVEHFPADFRAHDSEINSKGISYFSIIFIDIDAAIFIKYFVK